MKILSLLPRSRFTESGVTIPDTLPMTFFVPDGSHTLIAAAETCDALLLPPSLLQSDGKRTAFQVDRFCLERMPSVGFIQTTGAGFDSVDHLTSAQLGIPVSNSPGMNASSVAEYVIAAVVTLQRGLGWADRGIRTAFDKTTFDKESPTAGQRDFLAATRDHLLEQGGLELAGCKVGLVGLGHTAQALVPLLKAFGCTIAAYDVCWPEAFATTHQIQQMHMQALFAECDVVSLHCPLLKATRNTINYAMLARMKPTAVLVNAARGGIIVEEDLARILEEGRIRGAALDVFSDAAPHPDLMIGRAAERTLFTPHLAGVSRPAFTRMLGQALHNLDRVLIQRQPPDFVVNGVSTGYPELA